MARTAELNRRDCRSTGCPRGGWSPCSKLRAMRLRSQATGGTPASAVASRALGPFAPSCSGTSGDLHAVEGLTRRLSPRWQARASGGARRRTLAFRPPEASRALTVSDSVPAEPARFGVSVAVHVEPEAFVIATVHAAQPGLADDEDGGAASGLRRCGRHGQGRAAGGVDGARWRAGRRPRGRAADGVTRCWPFVAATTIRYAPGAAYAPPRDLAVPRPRDVALRRQARSANAVRTTAPAASTTWIVSLARACSRKRHGRRAGEGVAVLRVEQRRRPGDVRERRVDVDGERDDRRRRCRRRRGPTGRSCTARRVRPCRSPSGRPR